MSTVVNARDVLLQAASPRFLGIQVGSNVQVPIANVPGLTAAIDGTKWMELEGSSQVFQIPKTGSITPSSISVTGTMHNLTGTPTFVLVSGTMSVTPALTGGVFTFTPAQMTSDSVTFRYAITVSGTTYSDDYTVIKVREGADGITGLLTNENFTFQTDSAGNVSTYTGASGNFKVYQGSTDVTSACTFAIPSGGNPSSLTVSLTASGASAGAYSITGGLSAGTSQTTLTIRATFGSLTIDKVMSLSKAKAGTAGGAGASGARGSQTFYVAIAGTSFSDATATTTASVGSGPIVWDTVCQYNNTAGFSQSRYWNGSSWVVINAVVDGNLLVRGSVGAKSLVVNNGSGNNLWWDANFQDSSQWSVASWGQIPVLNFVTDNGAGSASGYVARSTTGNGSALGQAGPASVVTLTRTPVVVGKQYRISVKIRKSAAGNAGRVYIRADPNTAQTGSYNNNNTVLGLENLAAATAWSTYAVNWTATAPYVGLMVLVNYQDSASTGYQEWQDLRVEELMDSSLIVTGGVTADSINTNGLTIRDNSGNLILGVGTALNPAYAAAGTLNSAVSITSGGALSGAGGGQVTSLPIVDTRSVNAAPSAYAISHIKEFKDQSVIGIPGASSGTYCTLETLKQWTDATGGQALQWAYIDSSTVYKRSAAPNASSWGAWVRDLDRNLYTGDLNASYGATFGTNISGQITAGNASTYIAAAAIGSAQVGVLTAGNLTVAALSNTVNSNATTGGRIEITTNRVDVFDGSNQRRVRLGLL